MTNSDIIQIILDQIEDQLLVVAKDIPTANSDMVRSRILLDSLPEIVAGMDWQTDFNR